jgi:hypothetical protein
MNPTVLLALLVACAAIYLLRTVVVKFLKRKVVGAALNQVGKRALTRLPGQISLLRTDAPAWTDAAAVEQQAAPLRKEGFKDLGVYSVDKMPGALIRMMAHPETNVAAHICDHPKTGSWVEFVTRYTDGSSHALSTLPPTGMEHPEWWRKIQADRSTPTDQLYRQFLTQREWHNIKTVAPEETIHEFEENFRKLATWRQEHGLSTQEVAHVALKWIKNKQAAAGTMR